MKVMLSIDIFKANGGLVRHDASFVITDYLLEKYNEHLSGSLFIPSISEIPNNSIPYIALFWAKRNIDAFGDIPGYDCHTAHFSSEDTPEVRHVTVIAHWCGDFRRYRAQLAKDSMTLCHGAICLLIGISSDNCRPWSVAGEQLLTNSEQARCTKKHHIADVSYDVMPSHILDTILNFEKQIERKKEESEYKQAFKTRKQFSDDGLSLFRRGMDLSDYH